ncbi:MAG: hypothetical protein ACJ8DJ_04595 [Gemmatimonadales bacterium]
MARRVSIWFLLLLATALLPPATAQAHLSAKKAIWGPGYENGVSRFPRYRDLGVTIYQDELDWREIAATRPQNPRDPNDPAYQWPAEVSRSLATASRYHMRVALMLIRTPGWANGGLSRRWAPIDAGDFADFAYAASRRYPGVHLWMVWGEPSRAANFKPLDGVPWGTRRLSPSQAEAPRRYSLLLDAAYVALKQANLGNLVIGGMTYGTGDIPTWQFVRYMRLPNGRPPRMDLYGHNPFSFRRPDLRSPKSCCDVSDFSDLRRLSAWIDHYLARPNGRRHLRLYLSAFTLPTGLDADFNFHVDRRTQADWIRSAWRIVRGWSTIYAFGWIHLYDEPPRADGGPVVTGGLLDWQGRPKPGYFAFRAG